MRTVIQRVTEAYVTIDNILFSSIEKGLLIFIGIEDEDNLEDISWLSKKIYGLRIFDNEKGIMNLSIKDIGGEILVISQFTLHASTKKGNRPSFLKASKREISLPLYRQFIFELENTFGKKIASGIFGADMKVSILNDGPLTIIIDSKIKE